MKNRQVTKRNVYGSDGKVVPSRRGQKDSLFVTESYEIDSELDLINELSSMSGHAEYLEWVKSYATKFLSARDIPSRLAFYDSDGNTYEKRDLTHGAMYDLLGFVKAKYDHIPAAINAAKLISLTHGFYQIEDSSTVKKFDILSDISFYLRDLTIAHMEAFWHAGKSRTSEASKERIKSKKELISLTEPWLNEYLQKGKSKSYAYIQISKRLKKEGSPRSADTIKGWFNGR